MAGNLSVPNVFQTQSGNVPASQIDVDFSTIETYVNDREVTVGLLGARPAAGTAGRWYLATDVNGGTLYADTGSTWQQAGAGASLSSPVSFAAYRSTNQSLPVSTNTKVQFDTEESDSSGGFDPTVNFRFTVPAGQGGVWTMGWSVGITTLQASAVGRVMLFKNGSVFRQFMDFTNPTSYPVVFPGSTMVSTVTGDFWEIFVFQNSGTQAITGGAAFTTFWGFRVSS